MPQPVIIAGSHRSGTSLTAQYLHSCGLFLGDKLLAASESNPYGHFEDSRVVRFHDDIFRANSTSWMHDQRLCPFIPDHIWQGLRNYVEDRQISHRTWAFKDPRVCHFLPVWKFLLPNVKVLVVYRHPIECVRSLNKRHAEDTIRFRRKDRSEFYSVSDLALKIWTVSNAALADYAEENLDDVVVVNHRSLAEGTGLSRLLNEKWNLDLQERDTKEIYDSNLGLSKNTTLRVADPENAKNANLVWNRLMKLDHRSSPETESPHVARLDLRYDGDTGKILMENELLRFENSFIRRRLHEANNPSGDDKKFRKEIDGMRRSPDEAWVRVAELQKSYDAISSSTFWRSTKPMRRTIDWLRNWRSR